MSIRSLIAVLALAAATLTATRDQAEAFGDRCLKGVQVTGSEQTTMSSAMSSARGTWESRVRSKSGSRYASWNYSGDREMDCRWNASGSKFKCTAYAIPCG